MHFSATQNFPKHGSGSHVMPLLSRQFRRHLRPQPQAGNPAVRTARRISADSRTPCTSTSNSWPLSGTNCLASSSVGAVPSSSFFGVQTSYPFSDCLMLKLVGTTPSVSHSPPKGYHHRCDSISFMLSPFKTDAQVSQSASSTLLYFASNGLRVAVVRSIS